MQISLNLSESTIQQLSILPDADSFVEDVVKKALQTQTEAKTRPSKWALLAKEIEERNYFGGCSEQIKKDAKEVREGFVFPSDE